MIALSDDELAAVMTAAAPIPPRDRDQFLRDVASELSRYPELGPGIVGRVTAKTQRQHLAPRVWHNWPCGAMSESAALAFIVIVALMVALAVMVA
jgi:hypothetical protein